MTIRRGLTIIIFVTILIIMGMGNVISQLQNGGMRKAGIDPLTLVYVPSEYGVTEEHNVVVGDETNFECEYFDIIDGEDYCVPFEFKTKGVGLTRTLAKKDNWYTACLPYKMEIPAGFKAYTADFVDDTHEPRYHDILTFKRIHGSIEPYVPYVLVAQEDNASLQTDEEQTMKKSSSVAGQDVQVLGYTLRGTLKKISNKDAANLGAHIMQSDHKYYLVKEGNENVYIPAYRHFFMSSDNTQGSVGIKLMDDTDEVKYIETIEDDGTSTYYDLSGRKLPGKPERGVYVKDGKKVTVH